MIDDPILSATITLLFTLMFSAMAWQKARDGDRLLFVLALVLFGIGVGLLMHDLKSATQEKAAQIEQETDA